MQVKFRDTKTSSLASANSTSNTNTPTATTSNDIVLNAGHHIIVVSDGSVIVDHIFGGAAQAKQSTTSDPNISSNLQGSSITDNGSGQSGTAVVAATDKDTGATMGSTKKTSGPLTISNVNLHSLSYVEHFELIL